MECGLDWASTPPWGEPGELWARWKAAVRLGEVSVYARIITSSGLVVKRQL